MVQETNQIEIESLIDELFDRFDHIAEIYVAHTPSVSEISQLHITVHTGEAESLEQYLDLTTADEVTIDTGEAEPLSLPFEVMATVDGPGHRPSVGGTTVYIDNVAGAESRELETGISMLQQKVAGICPRCKKTVDSLQDHYIGVSACREAEQM